MAFTVDHPPRTLPLARGIPTAVAATVGRVTIHGALIEYHLLLVAKRLAGVGMKKARIVFATPRWPDYVENIQALAGLAQLNLGSVGGLRNRLHNAEQRRNLIVHSAWLKDGETFVLQSTRGNFTRPGTSTRVRRAVYPEGIAVSRAFLDESLRMLRACLRDLKALERRTRRLIE